MTNDLPTHRFTTPAHFWRWFTIVSLLLICGALVYYFVYPPGFERPVAGVPLDAPREASTEQVHQFCGAACHAYPPADTFPSALWRREIKQAYDFFRDSKLQIDFPSQETVALYYESRAPEELPLLKQEKPARELPATFRRKDYGLPGARECPGVSNVNLVHLFDERRLDLLVCEMRVGQVLALQPYLRQPSWGVLYSQGPEQGFNPAHAEIVDLDRDGIKDILVANLGHVGPTDAPCGSVVWLRGLGDGRFEPHTLLEGIGRVA